MKYSTGHRLMGLPVLYDDDADDGEIYMSPVTYRQIEAVGEKVEVLDRLYDLIGIYFKHLERKAKLNRVRRCYKDSG